MPNVIYLNGQEVPCIEKTGSILDPDHVAYDLPGHLVLDIKNVIKWIGPIDEEETELLNRLFRIDTDRLTGKNVRVLIETLGPIKQGR